MCMIFAPKMRVGMKNGICTFACMASQIGQLELSIIMYNNYKYLCMKYQYLQFINLLIHVLIKRLWDKKNKLTLFVHK